MTTDRTHRTSIGARPLGHPSSIGLTSIASAVTVIALAGCGGGASGAVRLATAGGDDLVRLGLTSSEEIVVAADDVGRLAASVEVPAAAVEQAATDAGTSPTWTRLTASTARVGDELVDSGAAADVVDAVRAGAAETACDAVLEGAPVDATTLGINILANAPTAPPYEARAVLDDTLQLAADLDTALQGSDEDVAAALLFCYAATL